MDATGRDPRGAEIYVLILGFIRPEIAGVTATILASPNANIGFVILACRTAGPGYMGADIVIVLEEHSRGAFVKKCLNYGPISVVAGLI